MIIWILQQLLKCLIIVQGMPQALAHYLTILEYRNVTGTAKPVYIEHCIVHISNACTKDPHFVKVLIHTYSSMAVSKV